MFFYCITDKLTIWPMTGVILSIQHTIRVEMGKSAMTLSCHVFASCKTQTVSLFRLWFIVTQIVLVVLLLLCCYLGILRLKYLAKSVFTFPVHELQVFYECSARTFSAGHCVLLPFRVVHHMLGPAGILGEGTYFFSSFSLWTRAKLITLWAFG